MFVAAQVVMGRDSLEAKNESLIFERKYKEAVQLAINYGTKVVDNTVNTNKERRGWA
jgi:hypothetical protein